MSHIGPRIGQLITWSTIGVIVVVTGWSLPIDDFWLTLASGEAISAGLAPLDEPLPFSWTAERSGALNPQWGAQWLLGAHGSLGGALAINALLLAAGIGFATVRAAYRAPAMAVVIALLLTLVALAPHLLARAQSFSIALFPLALLLLDRGRGRWWLPVAFGVLMVAWANVHGAFVIGQMAAVMWMVAAFVRRRDRGIAVVTTAVAAGAPIINPAGAELLVYAYAQPATDVVTAISVEWQPSWPWVSVAVPFWALLVAWIVGRAVRRPGAPLADLLIVALLGLLAVSAIRHIPWFLLAALPTIAADLGAWLDRQPRVRRAIGPFPASPMGRRGHMTAAVLTASVVAFQLVRPALPEGVARLTPDEPVAAIDALEARTESGDRVLNEQVWGGYLAYRLWPTVETAMDGRLEIRTRETWIDYFALMHGEGNPSARLAGMEVEWALLSLEREDVKTKLRMTGWDVVYADDYAVLLAAPPAPEVSR